MSDQRLSYFDPVAGRHVLVAWDSWCAKTGGSRWFDGMVLAFGSVATERMLIAWKIAAMSSPTQSVALRRQALELEALRLVHCGVDPDREIRGRPITDDDIAIAQSEEEPP